MEASLAAQHPGAASHAAASSLAAVLPGIGGRLQHLAALSEQREDVAQEVAALRLEAAGALRELLARLRQAAAMARVRSRARAFPNCRMPRVRARTYALACQCTYSGCYFTPWA